MQTLVSTPLSPAQITELWHKKSRINTKPPRVVLYDEIIKSSSLKQIFKGQDGVIVFYPNMETDNVLAGHYVALIKDDKKKTIYYYDPYGLVVDQAKYFSKQRDELYKEQNNSLVKLLLKLVKRGWTVDYSEYPHQSKDPRVSTCGRHSLMRNKFAFLSNDDYNKLVMRGCKKKGVNPDQLSVIMFH